MSLPPSLRAVGAGFSAAALVAGGGGGGFPPRRGGAFALPANAATATYRTTTDPLAAAGGWLATQFVDASHLPAPDGDHFDQKYGKDYFANYGQNADVLFGLAAAKVGSAKIATALHYLAANADAYGDFGGSQGGPYDGSIGKLALAAIVAGGNATSVGGHNLLATLKKDECVKASKICAGVGSGLNIYSSISESFILLAEARAGAGYAPSTAAQQYFDSLQCASGGFTDGVTPCKSDAADTDSTSYAIMAMTAMGGQSAQLTKAVAWLKAQQKSGGYWVVQNVANTNSTGLAAAALAGQRVDVSSARSWLRSQQVAAGRPGAGAITYAGSFTPTTTSATSPSVLATAQALTGLAADGSLATLTASGASSAVSLFAPRVAVSGAHVVAGKQVTVSGAGFAAGERVRVALRSGDTLTTLTAGAEGTVRARVRVPSSTAAGAQTLMLTGATSGLAAQQSLAVSAATPGSSAAPTSHTASTAPLADTGLDGPRLTGIAALGGLLVLLGGGLVFGVRRRAH